MEDELVALRERCARTEDERDRLISERRQLADQNTALTEIVGRLAAIAGKPIPIYVASDLRPLANLRTGATRQKVLVCSIPKSGTYLYARLLELLGLEPSGLHVAPVYVFDNRLKSPDQARRDIRLDEVELPIQDSIKLIAAGQFALSHLSPTQEILRLISDFRVLFVYRNLRDVLVSHMRYITHPTWGAPAYASLKGVEDTPEKMLRYLDQGGAAFFSSRCRPVVEWVHQPRALGLSFEQVYGDAGFEARLEIIDRIREFCGIDAEGFEKKTILQEVIGAATPTWSGARTSWRSCWDGDVERRFADLGGKMLNRELGYEE